MIDVLDYLAAEEATTSQAAPVKASAPADTSEGLCFEIDRDVLKVLLEKAIEVVPSKDMIPVLKNFQLRVRNGKISVVASNLNLSVVATTSMSVDTKISGVDVFPAKKLLNIVQESGAGCRVYISVIGRTAIIVAGSASWEISLGKGADFPRLPKITSDDLQEVDRAEFLRCLSTVKYAIGTNRDSLMLINVKNGRFTACDGNRLQQARSSGLAVTMKIPYYAVDKLIKMLKASDLPTILVGEHSDGKTGKLVFNIGADSLLVNKMDATFPELEKLWLRPALTNDEELIVERSLLQAAIKKVRVVVDLEYNAVSVRLIPGKEGRMGELVISASDGEDSAVETVPAQWRGNKRELVLHFRYLMDMLSNYTKDECLFKLGEDRATKKAPILLRDEELNSMGIIHQMTGVPTDRRKGPARR